MAHKVGDKAFGGIIYRIYKGYAYVVASDDQGSATTWAKAKSRSKKLKLKGYDDWSLPAVHQFYSMHSKAALFWISLTSTVLQEIEIALVLVMMSTERCEVIV